MCDGMSARDLAQVVVVPPGKWREPAAVPTPQSPGVVVPPTPAHWPGRAPRCLRQVAASGQFAARRALPLVQLCLQPLFFLILTLLSMGKQFLQCCERMLNLLLFRLAKRVRLELGAPKSGNGMGQFCQVLLAGQCGKMLGHQVQLFPITPHLLDQLCQALTDPLQRVRIRHMTHQHGKLAVRLAGVSYEAFHLCLKLCHLGVYMQQALLYLIGHGGVFNGWLRLHLGFHAIHCIYLPSGRSESRAISPKSSCMGVRTNSMASVSRSSTCTLRS